MLARYTWLQSILHERFGHFFYFNYTEDNNVKLTLKGSSSFIEIITETSVFSVGNSAISCLNWNAAAEGWDTAIEDLLPAPGAIVLRSPLIEPVQKNYRINYDVLGLTFWMLCRVEEIDRSDLDQYDRFPAAASHAYKYGYLERPIIDEWLHILGQVIQKAWPELQLKKNHFTIKVSHDVDVPSRYAFRSHSGIIRAVAGDILKRKDIKSAASSLLVRFGTKDKLHSLDPANNFDWIMDISENSGLKSAFYFICGQTDKNMDADYEPEHPAIRELMRRIHDRGHEIGIHPSFNSCYTPGAIATETERLKKICKEEGIQQSEWGGRMHYLRWQHPTTMREWELAGLQYDSTLSYAEHAGFRCGTCFEYPAFDPVANKCLKLRVRPLIAMENSILDSGYMGLEVGKQALNKFNELKNNCMAVNGCFTLLWHNSSLMSQNERNLYQSVLST